MWFKFDGSVIEMSHTSDRQKFRNLMANPTVSLCIADPDNLYRYVEVRGALSSVRPDPGATFHRALRARYGMDPTYVPDEAVRVVVTITPTWMGGRHMPDQTRRD
jgi:PPOX class probable F420-dependent enzyme